MVFGIKHMKETRKHSPWTERKCQLWLWRSNIKSSASTCFEVQGQLEFRTQRSVAVPFSNWKMTCSYGKKIIAKYFCFLPTSIKWPNNHLLYHEVIFKARWCPFLAKEEIKKFRNSKSFLANRADHCCIDTKKDFDLKTCDIKATTSVKLWLHVSNPSDWKKFHQSLTFIGKNTCYLLTDSSNSNQYKINKNGWDFKQLKPMKMLRAFLTWSLLKSYS